MRPPDCVACGLPVLELTGQSATLAPYLIVDASPPPATAGTWHLSCLAAAPVGQEWARALERSYLEVRRYLLLARTPDWSVVRNPNSGELLALGHNGATLPLSGHGPLVAAGGGGAYRVSEAVYWLEWDQPVIAVIQDRLRRIGSVPVRDVAAQLGADHRLSAPELLATAAFRLDPSLVPEWTTTVLGAPVDYAVPVPEELARYYDAAS